MSCLCLGVSWLVSVKVSGIVAINVSAEFDAESEGDAVEQFREFVAGQFVSGRLVETSINVEVLLEGEQ